MLRRQRWQRESPQERTGTLLVELGRKGSGGRKTKQSEIVLIETHRGPNGKSVRHGGIAGPYYPKRSRRVCQVMPRVQSKLSSVLHGHHGTKHLEGLRNQLNKTSKRPMVSFGGREKRAPWHLWNAWRSLKKTRWKVPCGEKLLVGVRDHTM